MKNKNFQAGGVRIVRCSINWDAADLRLVDFLAGRFTYRDAGEWRALIDGGTVTLNGKPCAPETTLALHDVVEYRPGELTEPDAELSYKILYEDECLLVADKPGNLCVHPAGPFFRHTLWFLLREKYGENIHFINRLDRETSGAMIVAFRPDVAAKMEKLPIEKIYRAVVHGDFPASVEARGFLFHDPASLVRKKRRYSAAPPPDVKTENCATFFRKVAGNGRFSLLEARLGTGRMHQIRATLLALGHPVVGDKLYGLDENFYLRQKHGALTENDRARLVLERQALHAWKLAFRHPVTGEELRLTADEPAVFRFADFADA